jgi:hypothetical protein
MHKIFLAAGLATCLATGVAFAGAQPPIPGNSVPLTSIVVLPPVGGGAPANGVPVFFTVIPPGYPGGAYTFTLNQ